MTDQFSLRRAHAEAMIDESEDAKLSSVAVFADSEAEPVLKEEDVLPGVVILPSPRQELVALCAELDDRLVQLALDVLKPRHFRA